MYVCTVCTCMVMQVKVIVVDIRFLVRSFSIFANSFISHKNVYIFLLLSVLGFFLFVFVVAILISNHRRNKINRPTIQGLNMGYLKEVFLAASLDDTKLTISFCPKDQADVATNPGGYSLVWPIRRCDAERGMVFDLSVLNGVYNFV